MKLARGTPHWVLAVVAFALFAVALGALQHPGWFILALLLGGLAALLVNFFRDPERVPAEGIASPADGVVTEVLEHEGRRRVNIFMNPLDVHVNRAPYGGRVVSVTHQPGGFVPAFRKESERNERVVVEFDTDIGPITTVHIAGTVARRIVPYVKAGDLVHKGDRIGIIRLGSRVDVYLPREVQVTVHEGQRVQAGATTLALAPEGAKTG